MLQDDEKRVRPSYSDSGLVGLEGQRDEALGFFEEVSAEVEDLLLDLYEYSAEIRKLIDKKGYRNGKFISFKFTAGIAFDNEDEAFFDFSLVGDQLCDGDQLWLDLDLIIRGYWTGEDGWRLTFDFDKADDALKAMVRDIEAFENDEEHEEVSVEAFDLLRTVIFEIIERY